MGREIKRGREGKNGGKNERVGGRWWEGMKGEWGRGGGVAREWRKGGGGGRHGGEGNDGRKERKMKKEE